MSRYKVQCYGRREYPQPFEFWTSRTVAREDRDITMLQLKTQAFEFFAEVYVTCDPVDEPSPYEISFLGT